MVTIRTRKGLETSYNLFFRETKTKKSPKNEMSERLLVHHNLKLGRVSLNSRLRGISSDSKESIDSESESDCGNGNARGSLSDLDRNHILAYFIYFTTKLIIESKRVK